MPLLPRLSSLWRNLFRKARKEQELTEEIDAYLEMLVEQKIEEGLDPAEARRAALIELGGREQVKEKVREARAGYQLETLWQDLRYATRMLLKHPVMTLIAVFTLALGIGANTAIFSVVNTVLLNALPYYEPQRLVWVMEAQEGRPGSPQATSYLTWQAQSQTFEHLVAYNRGRRELTGRGEPELLESLKATANVFPALGLSPQLGRAFTAEDDRPEAAPVALIGHALWHRRFGADPAIIGQSLTLGGQSFTVIGIMPPRSRSLLPLERADVWLPLAIDVKDERELRDHRLNVIGRLKPGFTLEQAHAEVNLIMRRLLLATPGIMNTEARATLLIENLVGKIRRGLLSLFGAVVLVLLIACANVANLLLGRAAMRQKEMAIRAAMGAGRPRLVRQMLTESLLLSLLGGATGLMLAVWGVKALVALAPDQLRHIRETSVDSAALGFTFLAALLTGLAAGLIPALQSSRIDLNEALKDGARRAATLRRRGLGRLSPALVIGEVALTLVLLAGAGLLINSYLRVITVEPGYDPENLLSLRIPLDNKKYPPGSPQERAFYQEILTRVKAIPGVKAVATGSGLPLTGYSGSRLLTVVGRPPVPDEQLPRVEYSEVSPEYFRTLGMQLRAGRSFTEQDDEKAPPVVIINETLARRYFSGEDPIGKQILPPDPLTIVGVAPDVKRFGLEAEAPLEIYCPYPQTQTDPGVIFLVVRTAGDPLDRVAAVRQQIYSLGVKQPISHVRTVDQLLTESVATRRFQMLLFSLFAAVALALAAVGVYGVIAYSVSRRTHEIGIRMALGARRLDVLLMVVRQGMTLALAGVSIGLAAALAVTRVLKGLLFELSVTDPLTLMLIAALLMGVTFLACYLPARGAPRRSIRCKRFARSENVLALKGVFMRGIWPRLILMALLIPVGWRNESLAQTTATSPPQKADEQEQRLRIVTNEVRIPLRAFDPMGRRVADLTAKEVLVIEDGVACQVTSLKREPANIMIVLDLSAPLGIFKSNLEDKETREKLFERGNYTTIPRPIAREFAEIVLRRLAPQNQVAIIQYADRVEMLQDWTRNPDEAISALRDGFRAGFKARFYDSLELAAARLQNAPAGRRVLVLVTDGLDSASMSAKQSAFEHVMATGASIYVISWTEIILAEARKLLKKKRFSREILSPPTFKRARELKQYIEQVESAAEDLKTLTAESGGEYWRPAVVSEFMLHRPDRLVSEVDSEYTLTYLSPKDKLDRPANIPEIHIARPGMSVFTRQAVKVKREAR